MTFQAPDVELAYITRGEGTDPVTAPIESRHRGVAVVLSPDGEIALKLGNVHEPVYMRSALKPLQTIGALKAGAPLRGAQVAIACASHRGTFEQMRAVQDVLAEAGTDASALQCPSVYPDDSTARTAMMTQNLAKTPLAYACSGKHAAFLWACAAKLERGELEPSSQLWTMESYLDPSHPLQQMIAEEIEEFAGEQIAYSGIDGCGAPVHAISPVGLARAYSTLGSAIRNLGADARASTVATAMVDYPELIQGPNHPDTVLSEELDAVVKYGAEGIVAIGLRSGASAVVKISDGSHRAAYMVALRALQSAGFLDESQVDQLLERVLRPVTGGLEDVPSQSARVVGAIIPAPALQAALDSSHSSKEA